MGEHYISAQELLTKIKKGHNFYLLEPIFDDKHNVLVGTEKVLTEKDFERVYNRAPGSLKHSYHVRTVIPHYIPEDKRIQWSAYLISLFEGGVIFKNLQRSQKDFVVKYLKSLLPENDYVIWKLFQLKNFSKKLFLHSINTTFIALVVYFTYNNLNFQGMIDARMVTKILEAGFLHDIGITQTDKYLADKKRIELKESQIKEYLEHTTLGYNLVRSEDDKHEISNEVLDAILNHEELLDGSGGPRGLREGQTTFLCQLVAVSSYFEMLVSGEWSYRARHYREYITKLRLQKTKYGEKLTEALDVSFKHLFSA
jgi:HD-GYP domain-containing protein (c-di-GMP phosphodiesterase class II)